ncbi:hypothetical protein GCM10011507_04950 [Edaphobacter acidisoli]|uniref:Uncharacterized protein n=1 Tax=Edaphobacter acidisoli TaxID=2040573 RepID=A0A916RHR4_9BACT|nr:hypothetical protein [Edaphobacter acidisoli]GGA56631.1 hypothetical protein GCM10011507_04950 [Edaphobacter acidisoli]
MGALFLLHALAIAQYTPIISGGIGFLDSTNTGAHFVQPVVAPLVAAPIGTHLLAESRFDFREFVGRKNGTSGPYEGTFFKSTQYLQLDYLATPNLTLVVGRFLTPFGTYNERLTPIWMQNFQDAPLITPIGTRTTGSSDGAMLRGVLYAGNAVHVDYVGYSSALSGVPQFQSARSAGDRIDFYFPSTRIELGTSYARFLQNTHYNSIGAHFWWQPWRVPLQVRSEYAHDPHAQGYWLESGYRLSQWRGRESLIGRLEPLFRIQQVFRNSPGPGDGLPSADTKQADFGFIYHLPNEVRFTTSYSRKFSSTGNANIWDVALTYRFLFPMWRGKR